MLHQTGLAFVRSLSAKEKAEMFDQIAKEYYDGNFGNFSKSQIDLLMFSLYLDKLLDAEQNFEDYTVSKQLGILETSVRQLKKKKQLVYPRDYKWYEAFLRYSEHAVVDQAGRIVISIPDPNVYLELSHAIEEIGGYVEVQLNAKLLKIPPGYYMELLLRIYQQEQALDPAQAQKMRDAFIKKLNKQYLGEDALEQTLTQKTLLTQLKEGGLEIALDVLKSMISDKSQIASSLLHIMENLFTK